jgi:hypothetical protein
MCRDGRSPTPVRPPRGLVAGSRSDDSDGPRRPFLAELATSLWTTMCIICVKPRRACAHIGEMMGTPLLSKRVTTPLNLA